MVSTNCCYVKKKWTGKEISEIYFFFEVPINNSNDTRVHKWWQEVNYPLNISVLHQPSLPGDTAIILPSLSETNESRLKFQQTMPYITLPLWQEMRVRSEREKKREKDLVLARTRAVNSPESCISEGEMGGWSQANTNTGLAREDLHRWARFPPFQILSPMPSSAALLHIPSQLSTAGPVIHWNLF